MPAMINNTPSKVNDKSGTTFEKTMSARPLTIQIAGGLLASTLKIKFIWRYYKSPAVLGVNDGYMLSLLKAV